MILLVNAYSCLWFCELTYQQMWLVGTGILGCLVRECMFSGGGGAVTPRSEVICYVKAVTIVGLLSYYYCCGVYDITWVMIFCIWPRQ